jgi:predicted RNase H-like HicB family nuclease
MRFLVRIYRYGESYSALAPDVPGCIAAGDSVEEVRTLMAEALGLHLDLQVQHGEVVPLPTKQVDLKIDELEEGELCTWVEVDLPQTVASSIP